MCHSGRRQRSCWLRWGRFWWGVWAPTAAASRRAPAGGGPRGHLQHVLWGRHAGRAVSAAAAAAAATAPPATAAGRSEPFSAAHAAHADSVALHDVFLQRVSCYEPECCALFPACPRHLPRAHDHARQRAGHPRRDQVLGAGRLPQKVRARPALRRNQRAANFPRHAPLGVRPPAQQPKAHDLQSKEPAAEGGPRPLAGRS